MKEKLIAMLKAAGVANPEAVAEAMIKDSANGKILIDDGKDNIFIPKSRLDAELDKKKGIQSQLDTAQSTIKSLEKQVEGNQTALNEIETYKAEKVRLENELNSTVKNTAIKEYISGFEKKAHDIDALMAFLKADDITVKDGKVIGLDEQLKELSTSKAFLFKAEEGGTGNPGNPGKGAGLGGKAKGTEGGKESIGAKLGKEMKETQVAPKKSFFE